MMVGRRGKVALEEVELEVKVMVTQIEEILDTVIDQIEVKEGLGVVLDVLALKKVAEVIQIRIVPCRIGKDQSGRFRSDVVIVPTQSESIAVDRIAGGVLEGLISIEG